MSDTIEVIWHIEDGYAGKDRPHYIEIRLDDFSGYEDREDIEEELQDIIRETFESKIGCACGIEYYAAQIEEKLKVFKKANEEADA